MHLAVGTYPEQLATQELVYTVQISLPSLSYIFIDNRKMRIVLGSLGTAVRYSVVALHLLRNQRIVLLEPIADALLRGHPLEDATVDAAGLAPGQRLGCEVVDAGGEAVLDEATERLTGAIRCQY